MAPSPTDPGELAGWFTAQRFAPGAMLPSERTLGEALGLSRFQVRQGLAALERQGCIEAARDGWRMSGGTEEATLDGAVVVLAARSSAPRPGSATVPNQAPRIWQGMEAAAGRHGLRLVTVLSHDLDQGFLRRLVRQRPVGLICLHDVVQSGQALAAVQAAWSAEIACVAAGDWVRPDEVDRWPADLVDGDHAGGAAALVRWLHARGARRPWLVGWRQQPALAPCRWWAARQAGFAAACAESGLAAPPALDPYGNPQFTFDQAGLLDQARILAGFLLEPLQAGADAFLMHNDGPALIISAALRLLGHRAEREVLVTGFDNCADSLPPDFRRLCPGGPLATYDKDEASIGARLVEVLVQRRSGRLPPEPQRLIVPGRLVELPPSLAPVPG